MFRNALTMWLWDGRRSSIVWALAIAGVGGMYAAFWPTIDDPQMQDAIAEYPEAIIEALGYSDVITAAGYLNATVYGLVVPILIIVYSVSAGTRIIAGDEEKGLLDLILAHPIGRTRLGLQRFAAFLLTVVAIAVALLLVLLALTGPARLSGISAVGFAAMNLHLVLFAGFFGALAYAVGAATGHQAPAIAAGAGMAVFGFAADGLLSQIEGFDWIMNWSPFHWLNGGSPLRYGVQTGDVLLMTGLVVVLVAVGTWAFNRRDVGA